MTTEAGRGVGNGRAFVVLVLAAVLLVSSLPTAGASQSELVLCTPPFHSSFVDVSGGPHGSNIRCLADLGLVQGIDGTYYQPRGNVTRAQMASFIARFMEHCLGTDLPLGSQRFPDLAGAHVHSRNIHKLYTIGVTDGITAASGGRFVPLQPVTRAQVASFISRALSYIDNGEARPEHQPPRTSSYPFPDDSFVHTRNVSALTAVGIIEGFPDGTFGPAQPLSRAQMASIIARAYQWTLPACQPDVTPPPPPPPPAPTVEITAPSGDEPAHAAAGDAFDVTMTVSDVASYVIEIRAQDGDEWILLDGGSGGALPDGSVTVTVSVPAGLPEGVYDLRVTVHNASGSGVDIAEGALEVVAPGPGTITGTIEVRGVAGPDVAGIGATVTATRVDDGEQASTTAGAGGHYTLPDLPAGTYVVVAELAGFAGTPIEVEVGADETVALDLVLISSVTGAFAVTVGGDPLGTEPLVADTTLEDVAIRFERTDDGDAIDVKVLLRIEDADGNEIDWSDPAEGIFTPETVALLLAALGTGPDDPTHTLDGESTITILDGASIGLGPNADRIARITLDLIDVRFLPDELVHERTDLDVEVLGVPDEVEVELLGIAEHYEQGATHTGTETARFLYVEGRGDVTATFNVVTILDGGGELLGPAELDALFAGMAFVDGDGQPTGHIRGPDGSWPQTGGNVVAPASIDVGIEFALQPDAPFGGYTLRLVAFDVSDVPVDEVSLAAALAGAYVLLGAAEADLVVIESLAITVDIFDVSGLPFGAGLQTVVGRSVDFAVRVENHTTQRSLEVGWFLAFEIGELAGPQAISLEVCERAPSPVPVLDDCHDVSDSLVPILLTDGRWLMQIAGLPESHAITPGEQRWHHFRTAIGEVGRFTSQVFLFEGT